MVREKVLWGFLVVCGGLMAVTCHHTPETGIKIHLDKELAQTSVTISIKDSVYSVKLDSLGNADILLKEDFLPEYTSCFYRRGWMPLYLEPGKSVEVFQNSDSLYFTGKGAEINRYLNSDFFKLYETDFRLKEKDFITSLEDRLKDCYYYLDSIDLDKNFKQIEKKRLYYEVYRRLALYPYQHARSTGLPDYRPSGEFVTFFESVAKEDESLMPLGEYLQLFRGLIEVEASREQVEGDPLQMLKHKLYFIGHQIKGPSLAAYLTDECMTGYVKNFGVDGIQELLPFYGMKVTDPVKAVKFRQLYAQWEKLANGQPSPGFNYPDIRGGKVSLADLKGKYVYIDVWATWCYFCCKEQPDLKRLEGQLEGKNICFVSISCDKDVEAWREKVEEEKLGGLQLNIGGNRKFMNDYLISGIPRFILLDQEGKIISANMTRPSNPNTLKMLSALPGL